MSWKLKEELQFIDENEEEIRKYVGKNAESYMNIWREGKKVNPAALFLGVAWLGYRGMYKIIMYLLVAFVITDILMIFLRIDLSRISGIVGGVILGWRNWSIAVFSNACRICILFSLCCRYISLLYTLWILLLNFMY